MTKKESQEGLTVKKEDDFSEWFTQVMLKSDLADYSLVSGCIVFKPYSYAIWEKVKEEVDKRIKKRGVKNAYFPLFIPEKQLSKESEHVKGFSPEVAWVTEAGGHKLDERLAVRPTSEAIMYDSYAKWVRSWRDLPLKINQWNNVVRWEFKNPVPFLRTREFLWNEGHTVFATRKEAEAERDPILNIYKDVVENYMALYGIVGQKTEKEKFAGAEYTCTIEYFMPHGRAVQGPDFHHDGQKFAKAFNIKFLNKEGKEEYAWQNTWAITTRMIGVMFAVHGDDKGLVLPPNIAPNKVVIIPILLKKEKENVLKKAKEIEKSLAKFDVILDNREGYTPGWKYNEWEVKGIPIRVEIGPRDIQKNQAILVRRDTNKKEIVKIKDLSNKIPVILEDIQKNLFEKSKKLLLDSIVEVKTMDELKKAIKNKKIAKTQLCSNAECEDWIKDKAGGAKTLNRPFDQPKKLGKCVYCGKPAKYAVYVAKSY